ncbi:MAG: hypothetical protein ACWGQW_02660 [bacterium]
MSEAPQDFSDLLNTSAEDAVRPPARPGGTYRATFKSSADTISSKKRTKGLEFTFSDLEPLSDVDQAAWDNYVSSPAVKPEEDTMTDTFWITQKSLYRIREFCEACGVDPKGKTLIQMVADALGERVLLTVQQTVGEKGTFSNITGYAKDE